MRNPNEIPVLPTLISETCLEGHLFPYTNANEAESYVWYWGVLRYKRHKLDFYLDDPSFGVAVRRLNVVYSVLKSWSQVVSYIEWYLDQENYAAETKWDFNYLISTNSINKYLKRDTPDADVQYWRNLTKQLADPNRLNGKNKSDVVAASKLIDWHEAQEDYAARDGTDSETVKRPFEK